MYLSVSVEKNAQGHLKHIMFVRGKVCTIDEGRKGSHSGKHDYNTPNKQYTL